MKHTGSFFLQNRNVKSRGFFSFSPETGEDSRKVCEDSNPYFTVRIVSGTHFVSAFKYPKHINLDSILSSGPSQRSDNSF